MKITIVIDTEGNQICSFNDDLVQVEVGQPNFMLGNTDYEVLKTETTLGGERFITVEKK